MAAPKKTRPAHERDSESFGLLANGSSGPWEVAVDEATGGHDRWFAQIEGPSVSFSFEVPSVEIVSQMRAFLESHPTATTHPVSASGAPNGWLVIGKDEKSPVSLVKDDECADRFFLVVGLPDSPVVRFLLGGGDAVQIADTLRQVEEDLQDQD
jgi:hypothetical protein